MVVLQDAVNEMSACKSRELSCLNEHTISSIVMVLPADLPVILFTEKPFVLSRNIWTPEMYGPPGPNISKYLDPL